MGGNVEGVADGRLVSRVGKGALFAPRPPSRSREHGGHAEPVIGLAEGETRWRVMTVDMIGSRRSPAHDERVPN